VSLWYIDTSAAMKLLVAEAETEALSAAIVTEEPDFAACYLLETEVRRATERFEDLTQRDAVALLDGISLHEVSPSLFREAGLLPGEHLRSLDAVHLAAAIRIGVERIVTYDSRMIVASHAVGIPVFAPGLVD
jgi:uncharacterized protein